MATDGQHGNRSNLKSRAYFPKFVLDEIGKQSLFLVLPLKIHLIVPFTDLECLSKVPRYRSLSNFLTKPNKTSTKLPLLKV